MKKENLNVIVAKSVTESILQLINNENFIKTITGNIINEIENNEKELELPYQRIIDPKNQEQEEKYEKLLQMECDLLKYKKENKLDVYEEKCYVDYFKDKAEISYESKIKINPEINIKKVLRNTRFILKFENKELNNLLEPMVIQSVLLPRIINYDESYTYTEIFFRDLVLENSKYSSVFNIIKNAVKLGYSFDYTLSLLDEKGETIEIIKVKHEYVNEMYSTSLNIPPLNYGNNDIFGFSINFQGKM